MPRLNSYPTVTSITDNDTVPVMQGGNLKQVARSNMGLAKQSDLDAHTTNTANPHAVTKAQVGLGNVDNTSDANKPVSTATQTALNGKAALVHTHASTDITDFATASDARISAQKGAANGLATLDGTSKVPAAQLPSYVDDVLEYANTAAFPATGSTGLIYVALDTNKIYRWSGSSYIEISPSPGSTDSVPEGSTNKYYTDSRAAAAAPVQSVAGKTGAITLAKADVGLPNVDNTADTAKPVSTAQQSAIDAKVSKSGDTMTGDLAFSGTGHAGLKLNQLTTTQRDALTAVNGMLIYNTTTSTVQKYENGVWADVGSGGGGGGATNLSTTQTSTSVTINSDTGTDATIPAADATNAGVMTAAQQTKLAGVASGATANQTDAYLLSRANHTGTQTASTISDFDAQVYTSRLDQMAPPTADLSMNGHKVTNVTDPTSAQDAATKSYVDAAAAGIDWKASVRAASTINHTLTAPGATVDGVTLNNGDRILLKNQTTASENGVYIFNGASSTATRATDADTAAEVNAGLAVFVEEGTTNANSGWVLTTANPITLGTTGLTFTQFTGLGEVTAGTGLSKTGNTLSVSGIPESAVTNLVSDLAAKAPLASPTLTGTPAAPTATAGTNTTQIATTAFVTAAVAAGGGGGGGSNWFADISDNCGANSSFLETGASFIDGGVGTITWDSSSRAIRLDTTTTANSGAEARLKPNGNYFSWSNTNYYQYWEVADISISPTAGGLFFGSASMDSYGAGYIYTNPHVGFRRQWSSGIATTYASCANNTANSTVSFTPTNNNTNCNVLSFYRTPSSVKFYDVLSGTLVATITTNIYTSVMSNIAVIGVSNAATATAVRALLYSFSMSRQATF